MTSEDEAERHERVRRFWEALPKEERVPRTPDAVGVRCAADGCSVTKGITYDKPLCYEHWKDFDRWLLFECERCHWFDDTVGVVDDDYDLCFECRDRERRELPPTPVYAHAPVEHRTRYLYILKLDGGQYYVGQTNNLQVRIQEHRDGVTASTRGKNPKLVYFETWEGHSEELNEAENTLTRIANNKPRTIRVMVEEWQKLFRLVDFNA